MRLYQTIVSNRYNGIVVFFAYLSTHKSELQIRYNRYTKCSDQESAQKKGPLKHARCLVCCSNVGWKAKKNSLLFEDYSS